MLWLLPRSQLFALDRELHWGQPQQPHASSCTGRKHFSAENVDCVRTGHWGVSCWAQSTAAAGFRNTRHTPAAGPSVGAAWSCLLQEGSTRGRDTKQHRTTLVDPCFPVPELPQFGLRVAKSHHGCPRLTSQLRKKEMARQGVWSRGAA